MSSPTETGRTINEGAIRLRFEYAAGDVAGRAIRAARSRRVLLGSRCAGCDRILAPARSLCPACGGTVTETVQIGPDGTVESWTEVPGSGVFLLVRPDGADTALAHRLAGIGIAGRGGLGGANDRSDRNPRVGGRVTAVFDESGLAGFAPIEPEGVER